MTRFCRRGKRETFGYCCGSKVAQFLCIYDSLRKHGQGVFAGAFQPDAQRLREDVGKCVGHALQRGVKQAFRSIDGRRALPGVQRCCKQRP